MGSSNNKPLKTFETHTSFDVLPTEYFNRRALQQKYGSQVHTSPLIVQQPMVQAQPEPISYLPQQQQQQQPPQQYQYMMQPMPQAPQQYQQVFYTIPPQPIQHDYCSSRLVYPPQTQFNQAYPQPLIQSYGMKPNTASKGHTSRQQHISNDAVYLTNLPRKQFGANASSTSTGSIIQPHGFTKFVSSTPKFL